MKASSYDLWVQIWKSDHIRMLREFKLSFAPNIFKENANAVKRITGKLQKFKSLFKSNLKTSALSPDYVYFLHKSIPT